MDFLTLVSAKQKDKKLSDLDVSRLSGIDEYTYYNLKKYRVYLSKVAYFSLCSVLGIPVLSDAKVEDVLKENREIVGLPESNLSIAAECVNPEYLAKMENELAKLKDTVDTAKVKDEVIKKQSVEIDGLKREIEGLKKKSVEESKVAYQEGIKQSIGVEVMKTAESQHFNDLMKLEYEGLLEKAEKARKETEEDYYRLYKYLYELSQVDERIKLNLFRRPLRFQEEMIKTKDYGKTF